MTWLHAWLKNSDAKQKSDHQFGDVITFAGPRNSEHMWAIRLGSRCSENSPVLCLILSFAVPLSRHSWLTSRMNCEQYSLERNTSEFLYFILIFCCCRRFSHQLKMFVSFIFAGDAIHVFRFPFLFAHFLLVAGNGWASPDTEHIFLIRLIKKFPVRVYHSAIFTGAEFTHIRSHGRRCLWGYGQSNAMGTQTANDEMDAGRK